MTLPTNERVTIIIVTHNSSRVIKQCLDAIPENTPIIVVDNASSDDTVEIVSMYPHITCIKGGVNLGYGRANNIALEQVNTEFALLLNPDAMLEANTIDKLVNAAERYPNAAILVPRLKDQRGYYYKSFKESVFTRDYVKYKYFHPEGDICANYLSGAVWLVQMELLKNIGFFDPKIFLYYEDDDLCMRARKHNLALVMVHDAEATHLGGQSSPVTLWYLYRKNWHMVWSRLYLESKYHGPIRARMRAIRMVAEYMLKTLLYCLVLRQDKITRCLARALAACTFMGRHP